MAYTRIAAVTGANKGIGFAIVRNLALQYPNSAFNNGPLLIYLTARDQTRGEQALKDIHNDPQLSKAKALRRDGGLTDVKYHQLDISSSSSISNSESFLKTEHPAGIDILVNNAGIALTGFDASIVAQTLQTNYHGTLHLTTALRPHVRPGGRIVNVSSMVGKLNKYSPSLAHAFRSANTVQAITALMTAFHAAVEKGSHEADGWPSSAYAVSKAGVTGMTGVVGREEKGRGRGLLVNSCCPGYVATDMTRGNGRKTVDEGARTPVLLALGDLGGRAGEFWEHEEVSVW